MRLDLLTMGVEDQFVVPRRGDETKTLRKVARKLHKEGLLILVQDSNKEFVYETSGAGEAYITHHKLIKELREADRWIVQD